MVPKSETLVVLHVTLNEKLERIIVHNSVKMGPIVGSTTAIIVVNAIRWNN